MPEEIRVHANRVRDACLALPEVVEELVDAEHHLIFRVRKRTFAYFLHDHNGDGETAVCCKVAPGLNQSLIDADPARFYWPAYLGHRGWVSARLTGNDVDWDELRDLIEMSYRLVAPRTLVRNLPGRG